MTKNAPAKQSNQIHEANPKTERPLLRGLQCRMVQATTSDGEECQLFADRLDLPLETILRSWPEDFPLLQRTLALLYPV